MQLLRRHRKVENGGRVGQFIDGNGCDLVMTGKIGVNLIFSRHLSARNCSEHLVSPDGGDTPSVPLGMPSLDILVLSVKPKALCPKKQE